MARYRFEKAEPIGREACTLCMTRYAWFGLSVTHIAIWRVVADGCWWLMGDDGRPTLLGPDLTIEADKAWARLNPEPQRMTYGGGSTYGK